MNPKEAQSESLGSDGLYFTTKTSNLGCSRCCFGIKSGDSPSTKHVINSDTKAPVAPIPVKSFAYVGSALLHARSASPEKAERSEGMDLVQQQLEEMRKSKSKSPKVKK